MKVFKKKLVQRLGCILGAILFAVFSVFAVSPGKNQKLVSASAEGNEHELADSYAYYLYIPTGTLIERRGTNVSFIACISWRDVSIGSGSCDISIGYYNFNFNNGSFVILSSTYTSPNLLLPILKSSIPSGLNNSYNVSSIGLFKSKFNVFSFKQFLMYSLSSIWIIPETSEPDPCHCRMWWR